MPLCTDAVMSTTTLMSFLFVEHGPRTQASAVVSQRKSRLRKIARTDAAAFRAASFRNLGSPRDSVRRRRRMSGRLCAKPHPTIHRCGPRGPAALAVGVSGLVNSVWSWVRRCLFVRSGVCRSAGLVAFRVGCAHWGGTWCGVRSVGGGFWVAASRPAVVSCGGRSLASTGGRSWPRRSCPITCICLCGSVRRMRQRPVVRAFKGRTARVLRQGFPYLRRFAKVLWSPSYFAASVAYVSESTVRRYIEHQWDAVAS